MSSENKKLALFFTWDVSLSLWKERGLLAREIRLYQELAARGVDITFLSWGGEEDLAIAADLAPIKVVPLYAKIPRPGSKIMRALCSFFISWTARDTLKACDFYKTNQMWGGWYAALAAIIYRKPLIARCGFELYQFTIRHGHGWARRIFTKCISWLTYKAARKICVATEEDRQFVSAEFGITEEKIHLHPNWIDTDFFKPVDLEERPSSILYVGRLNAQKNLPMLIEAVAGTDWALDIAGEGELRGALDEKAKSLGAKVNFLGALPNDQLPALYNQYPVYVLPSHYEGNPKTLLEAMACGRAVLGTDVPGIQSVIAHEYSGLLCPPSVEGIREGISRLMTDAALRKTLGENARAQILEHQTLDRLVQKELALYESLLERKNK